MLPVSASASTNDYGRSLYLLGGKLVFLVSRIETSLFFWTFSDPGRYFGRCPTVDSAAAIAKNSSTFSNIIRRLSSTEAAGPAFSTTRRWWRSSSRSCRCSSGRISISTCGLKNKLKPKLDFVMWCVSRASLFDIVIMLFGLFV